MIPLVLLLLLSLLSCGGTKAEAKPVLTATCEAPTGSQLDDGIKPKPKFSLDSFTGITPIIIVNDDDRTMTILWEGAKTTRVSEDLSVPSTAEAKII